MKNPDKSHEHCAGDVVMWCATGEEFAVQAECLHGVLATKVEDGGPGLMIPVVFLWSSDIEPLS